MLISQVCRNSGASFRYQVLMSQVCRNSGASFYVLHEIGSQEQGTVNSNGVSTRAKKISAARIDSRRPAYYNEQQSH